MPGPIEATGAVKNPTKYGALSMGARQFTGLVTQRSPYRDGAVPYLVGKFYGGSRFDTILDGLNREITQRLTDKRAPGSIVYNGNTFPGGLSFYEWKYIQNAAEKVRVLYDGADGTIYDATAGQKSTLFTKSAGAGAARFLGVNTELFFADGVEQKKAIETGTTWQATTNVLPGTLINQGATPGVVYMALGGMSLPIIATTCATAGGFNRTHYVFINPQEVPENFPNLVGVNITFSGLTVDTTLNGQTLAVSSIVSTTLGIFTVRTVGGTVTAKTPDTGTATTGNGITSGAIPAFTAAKFAVTADAGQQWKSYGSAVQNWGLAAPTAGPTFSFFAGGGPFDTRFWQPSTNVEVSGGYGYTVLDPNGNIQLAASLTAGASEYVTGYSYPPWNPNPNDQYYSPTIDGSIVWLNLGPPGTWTGSATNAGLIEPSLCILDSNQNLQWLSDGEGASSGTTEPTWGTTFGATVTDGGLTWTCLGAGTVLTTGSLRYAYSYHGVDGSVSTASAVVAIEGGILGPGVGLSGVRPWFFLGATLASGIVPDVQTDQIWIWRTAQGQATLILEDQIPVDGLTTSFEYGELGIPDTSATGGGQLNPFIPAPVADANDPPPARMTAPVYYQQRIWGIVDNMVVHSGGPDTITGNGNTAFAPLDEVPFVAQPIKLIPVLVQNGGLIVMTTSGIKIILGTGTPTNPYYVGDYLELVSVLNYNAVSVFYNQIFCMESNGKVSSIAIEYPFNPQSGYTEVGFPIGDQFVKTTTGGQNSALFNPATAYLSWNANSSADTGMYVSNGSGFWFRMSLINSPETGILWAPLRQLQGGASAVQSVEVTSGIRNLLIAPPTGTPGPILMRDTTGATFTDEVAGTPTGYPAWDAKGVTLLCSTGQWAEVVHISAKSTAVGARPVVSVLLNEIQPSPDRPYNVLNLDDKSNDPSKTPRSLSAFSDRYVLKQNGANTLGDCLLTKFDYGSQAVGDELLDWGILARVHEEREEEVAPTR